jgi:hypothetical protein
MNEPGPHSRDELRKAYVDAWRKHRSGLPLAPLEAMLADIIEHHPEYHSLLEAAGERVDFEPDGSGTTENPFLHMGLHMAVHEQLAIDRPPGVRALHARGVALRGDPHGADHIMMDALAETLWEAQRANGAADESRYLERARRGFDILAKG